MRVDEVFPVESLRSVSSAYLQHGANPNFCRALLVSLPAIGGAWSRQVRTDRPLGSPRLRGPRIEPRDVGDYSREVLGLYLKRPARNRLQLNDLGKGASDTAT